MTTATRRKADPSPSLPDAQTADALTQIHTQASPDQRPATTAPQAPAPALLLAPRALLRTHPAIIEHLRQAPFELHAASSWERLLAESEQLGAGVVLVDLDAAERSHSLRRLGLSGHRLVTLLARQLAEKAVALVVLSALDYAEIEDLMRAGVHALLHPERESEWCAEQVRAAYARRHAPQSPRSPQAPSTRPASGPVRDLVPVPSSTTESTQESDGATYAPPAAEPIAAFL
jgi:DNA-binding NarL/FixJ family response regulator